MNQDKLGIMGRRVAMVRENYYYLQIYLNIFFLMLVFLFLFVQTEPQSASTEEINYEEAMLKGFCVLNNLT